MKGFAFVLSAALMTSSCAIAPPESELFDAKQIETSHFSIAVWEKKDIQKDQPLRIYFEGDGNPNPKYAVAFDLAKADTNSNVIYVARPCQWVNDKICEKQPEIYQDARFHPEVMMEMRELVIYLMRKYRAPSVDLIGYDGGAVIALNLATKVPTQRVITIAGITDINAYNDLHDLPLPDEDDIENPADNLALLAEIPQIHYVGEKDDVTPRRLVERFVSRMDRVRKTKSAIVRSVSDTDHTNWEGVRLDY